MGKVKTVITKAKELIDEVGHDAAKKYFQDKIKAMGDPQTFEDVCMISGWETAIEYIDGKY